MSVVKVSWAKETGSGHGTGFYIGGGRIITAAHVAAEAPKGGAVAITFPDGSVSVGASVVWTDKDRDTALIQLPFSAEGLAAPADLACAESDAAVRTNVTTIGFPLSLGKVQRWGRIASNTDKDFEDGKASQLVDMPAAPGDSGSAVFDEETGKVVGLVRAFPMMQLYGPAAPPAPFSITIIIPRSSICAALVDTHEPFKSQEEENSDDNTPSS